MITVSIQSKFSDKLSMTITYEESVESVELDDLLDVIQDVYSYIHEKNDKIISFNIGRHWISLQSEDKSISVSYTDTDNLFKRICSRCEINVYNSESITLRCFDGDELVLHFRLM